MATFYALQLNSELALPSGYRFVLLSRVNVPQRT